MWFHRHATSLTHVIARSRVRCTSTSQCAWCLLSGDKGAFAYVFHTVGYRFAVTPIAHPAASQPLIHRQPYFSSRSDVARIPTGRNDRGRGYCPRIFSSSRTVHSHAFLDRHSLHLRIIQFTKLLTLTLSIFSLYWFCFYHPHRAPSTSSPSSLLARLIIPPSYTRSDLAPYFSPHDFDNLAFHRLISTFLSPSRTPVSWSHLNWKTLPRTPLQLLRPCCRYTPSIAPSFHSELRRLILTGQTYLEDWRCLSGAPLQA